MFFSKVILLKGGEKNVFLFYYDSIESSSHYFENKFCLYGAINSCTAVKKRPEKKYGIYLK